MIKEVVALKRSWKCSMLFWMPQKDLCLFLTIVLSIRYGQGLGSIGYIQYRRELEKNKQKEADRFNSTVYRLKKQGFIKKEGNKFLITALGNEKYNKITRMINGYKEEDDDTLKIIIFDIPEEERRKRYRLREGLMNMGFKMVQKSVWSGKKKISKEFLDDAREEKIMKYIHIFSVSKKGTLEEIGF